MKAAAVWMAQWMSLGACAGYSLAAWMAATGEVYMSAFFLVLGILATVMHTAVIFDS